MYVPLDHTFSLSENFWMFTDAVSATTGILNWQVWEKPKWCRGVFITAIAGGQGGRGGAASAAGVAASGGSGGPNGGSTTCFFPAFFLPDRLYISVGQGGAGTDGQVQGGSAPASAINGSHTYVASDMNIAAEYLFVYALAASGGSAAIAATWTTCKLSNYGFPSFIGGDVLSNANTNSVYFTVLANTLTTSGAGGGNVNAGTTTTAGAKVVGNTFLPDVVGGLAGGGAGNAGYFKLFDQIYPYTSTGGSGGGANTSAGVGGAGGNGGYGSGGGGGGGSNGTASVGGRGGDGGPGIVMIQAI